MGVCRPAFLTRLSADSFRRKTSIAMGSRPITCIVSVGRSGAAPLSGETPEDLRLRSLPGRRLAAGAGRAGVGFARFPDSRCPTQLRGGLGNQPLPVGPACAGRGLYAALDACAGVHELHKALEAGVDDFLAKPVVYCEFLARLRVGARELELERRLGEQARVDPLTGLPNRRALESRLKPAVVCRHGQIVRTGPAC